MPLTAVDWMLPALIVSVLALVACVAFLISARKRLSEVLEAKRTSEDLAGAQLRAEQDKAAAALRELELSQAKLQADLNAALRTISELKVENQDLHKTREEYLQLQVRYQEQSEKRVTEQKLLEETKQALFKEFELAAGKLFDEKKERFESSNKEGLQALLQPFREQIMAFNKRVEDVYDKENTQRNQLVGQIIELQKQTQQISAEANNLAAALKNDNKIQGSWGEIVLERLLEQSGLQKGREYDTQKSFSSADGSRFRPDVIVHLPDEKDIVIDSKVSLVDYERYCSAENQAEKDIALKAHVDSVRAHVKGLSLKQYENLEGIRTLDFVFVFVPVEAAYIVAIQSSPTLFKEAYDRNIVIVSPSSLMVALRTVETIWRYEKQNANAEQIAASAGKLYDQFALFVESLEEVGKNLDRTQDAFGKAKKRLTEGRGNLLRKIDGLKELGAKTSRRLPEAYRVDQDDEETESVSPKKAVKGQIGLLVKDTEASTEGEV
ncbi:DNA recombination protein RmuC [Saccharophagus degradans]|uniref:DNA recombination protein RmuC n=1 Tax=Saccharophagus degradans TaxID=86304 RepID=UPI001C0A665D|nr:DNA recombination protein RmuC [Saccharophagus degradans]MBU2984025.1 DNA recombination protein RmuC [Saccharophagus degradans]